MTADDPVENREGMCGAEHTPGRMCVLGKGHPDVPFDVTFAGPITVGGVPAEHRADVRALTEALVAWVDSAETPETPEALAAHIVVELGYRRPVAWNRLGADQIAAAMGPNLTAADHSLILVGAYGEVCTCGAVLEAGQWEAHRTAMLADAAEVASAAPAGDAADGDPAPSAPEAS